MKALEYQVHTCVEDSDGVVHAIIKNTHLGHFCTLFLDNDKVTRLMDLFEGECQEESTYLWQFIADSWKYQGWSPISIVLTHDDSSGCMIPTVTFLQDQGERGRIHLTIFIPIGAAIEAASRLNVPMFVSESAQAHLKKREIGTLNSYIKEVESEG